MKITKTAKLRQKRDEYITAANFAEHGEATASEELNEAIVKNLQKPETVATQVNYAEDILVAVQLEGDVAATSIYSWKEPNEEDAEATFEATKFEVRRNQATMLRRGLKHASNYSRQSTDSDTIVNCHADSVHAKEVKRFVETHVDNAEGYIHFEIIGDEAILFERSEFEDEIYVTLVFWNHKVSRTSELFVLSNIETSESFVIQNEREAKLVRKALRDAFKNH